MNTEKVKDLTLEQWIEKETAPREISLWGTKVQDDFVPEICSIEHGDGKQLIYFGTINQRPRWWLILIDSKQDIESDNFDIEGIVIDILEDEFRTAEDWISEDQFEQLKAEGDEECEICETYRVWLEENYKYPRLQLDGYHWGLVVNMVTGQTG